MITGAAQGIGKSIACKLAQNSATVILTDIDDSRLQQTTEELNCRFSSHCQLLRMDVTKPEEIEASINRILTDFGKLDILVNNAGVNTLDHRVNIDQFPQSEWQRILDVDLTGVFNVSQLASRPMIKQKEGRIVNIASIAGKEGNPTASPYSASKAEVIALTKSLGKELALKNIAVNSVTPAAAKTRIFEQITQKHIDYMLSKIPRNRFVKVEELASMACWMVVRHMVNVKRVRQ